MTNKLRFPYKLKDVLFSTVKFERGIVPEGQVLAKFDVQVKTIDEGFPKSLQVNLKVETSEESPVDIRLVLIGLFELLEEQDEPGPEIIPDLLNERVLFMLWPYITQMVMQTTTMMGIPPINIPTPFQYNFAPSGEEAAASMFT